MTPTPSTDARIRIDALVALGQALHSVGQPSHRLERMLVLAARRLGLILHPFCLPTGLLLSFEVETGTQVRLLRMPLGTIHLERDSRLATIADDLIAGRLSPAETPARINAVMQEPDRWSPLATIGAYVFSAGAFSVFFRGGEKELLVAVWVGLAVGLVAIAMRHVRQSSRLFELIAAAAAAVIACAADSILGTVASWVPLASGLIILLPGISLVDAVDELANGHLASGGARLAGVAVAFLALTFGTVLGEVIAGHIPDDSHAAIESGDLPDWTIVPALVVVAAGSMIRFSARPVDFFTGLAGSATALLGARVGLSLAGPFGGPFLAALLLGLVANGYARWRRQAPGLLAIPGIALLVPGSVGVRSLSALLSEEITVGIDAAFHMFLIAMALVGGLLFSNSIIRTKESRGL
jgi:uncharacterized membrane protein YjjP (DUF1212 family)